MDQAVGGTAALPRLIRRRGLCCQVGQNAGQFQDPPHDSGRVADEQDPSDPVGGVAAGDEDADRRAVQQRHRAQADLDVTVPAAAGDAGDGGVEQLSEFRRHREVDLAPQREQDPPGPFLERALAFHDHATCDPESERCHAARAIARVWGGQPHHEFNKYSMK